MLSMKVRFIKNIIKKIYILKVDLIFLEACKTTIDYFGNIDIIINNAGILNDFKWETEIAVNMVSFSVNNQFIMFFSICFWNTKLTSIK